MSTLQDLGLVTRPCYVCGHHPNKVIAREPVEIRRGLPLTPEGEYVFAECSLCGTLYLDSDIDDDYLNEIYRAEHTLDETGEGIRTLEDIHTERGPEFERNWSEMKIERRPQAGELLLDVGSQLGDFGSVAQRDGLVPNGIELSEHYAEACSAAWGPAAVVHLGRVEDANFAQGSFQYVTCFETLEHMLDPRSALRKFREWIADDGLLAISVPSSDYFHLKFWLLRRSPARRVFGRLRNGQLLPHTHIYNFSPRSLRQLCVEAQFRPIRHQPIGWKQSMSRWCEPVSRVIARTTGGSRVLAPSILVLAKPA